MTEKKKGRRAYLSDFRLDVSGQYVYTGAVYRYVGRIPRRLYLARSGVWAGLLAVAVVIPGILEAPAMLHSFYVILPYIGEVIAAALTVWAVVRLILHSPELRAYVYRGAVESLPARLWATVGCAAAGAAGNGVFLLLNGFCGKPLLSLLVPVCQGAAIAAALLLRRTMRGGEWTAHADAPQIEP